MRIHPIFDLHQAAASKCVYTLGKVRTKQKMIDGIKKCFKFVEESDKEFYIILTWTTTTSATDNNKVGLFCLSYPFLGEIQNVKLFYYGNKHFF